MEVWKDIPGYEGHYQVSSFGRVKSLERYTTLCNNNPRLIKEKILKCKDKIVGYKQVTLSLNGVVKLLYIHRLVLITFISNPDNKPCGNHVDGNKNNNCYTNLEWVTYSENTRHAFNIGLMNGALKKNVPIHSEETKVRMSINNAGEGNKNSKLTESDITSLRKLFAIKKCSELSKMFGISKAHVYRIINKEAWKHI